ncbi:alpha-mannosidase I MNS5 isoform X1 [Dendrobium catenatum]|uniref:alpha-1,2-Mannosidase n=1 Tax=Dendrobium catenatum TaxID=906689 RepID=A0A2I0XGW9_9ASPA|nr:alpha-mannosidase I MNS5 isoform X1 [Dendrobium catenatum]PKU87140.1 putative alpha-mannosidase I MNS5 [Dendrobium catenatum]
MAVARFRSILALKTRVLIVSLLLLNSTFSQPAAGFGDAKRRNMKEKVRQMFYHAYENYMAYAFPHDELKPITSTFTDSLSELGNLKLEHLPQNYQGSALTLIESLSSLVVLGNNTEFEKGVLWLAENLSFDVDARVNLFECNIRVLGGLLSAHILATDSKNRLERGIYQNQLLDLAEDLGRRFLRAFDTPTGLPYAWINLKYGVVENETTETSTSGCGSLILEMGALSRLTGNPRYENAARHALQKLWSMRSSLNLLGTTLDVVTGEWIEYSSGIGAGVDSFYEYLLKAYILFGSDEFWDMFHSVYLAVQKYFRHGPWYHEADMRTGRATYWQLTSLQAFWPGLQILIGDVAAANASHREFYHVWERFGVLPERYLLDRNVLHPTEKYYPLRPELAESTFYLYQATKDPWYMEVGESIVSSLNRYAKVTGGFASIRDVTTMQQEDHQHSFFLSETCKYLYLLYDDTFLAGQNYIFTTEGHPLPIRSSWHEKLPESYIPHNWTRVKNEDDVLHVSSMSLQVCPVTVPENSGRGVESACHIPDNHVDHRCRTDGECGIDSTTCRQRTCSIAGYCGLWVFID